MYMKRILAMLLMVGLLLSVAAVAEGETGNQLSDNARIVYETIKYSVDFPKDAQVKSAMEYLCKIDQMQMHLLLVEATQNENIEMLFGRSAGILLINLETNEVITYSNFVSPESSEINSEADAMNLLYNSYSAYLEGYNEFIWTDSEIIFPLSETEIDSINSELTQFFTK